MESTNPVNSLKDFALTDDVNSKSGKEFGKKIVLQVENLINGTYFTERNRRFTLNRQLAAGKMDMRVFQDLLDMFGKVNYVKLDYKPPMIVNTIVSRLVSRWMGNRLKPKAEAVDPISLKDKKDKIETAEFYLDNKEMLAQVSEQSGVPMIPQDQFVAEDKDHLDLWAHEELRLPEEILYEKGIRTVFKENKLDTVQLRQLYRDSAEVGLMGIETCSYGDGIKTRVCVPENMFYSNSNFDDFHDTSIRGEVVSFTISEIRATYPNLTEEQVFDIAKMSKDWQNANKITWDSQWNISIIRPYDDWNVDVAVFELRTLDVDRYGMKVTSNGNLLIEKNAYQSKLNGDVSKVTKEGRTIYRGCYVRNAGNKFLLEWGRKKNAVTPQEYEYSADQDFSFSFFMYQNTNMRNVAIPEKIEEPVMGMALVRLKIQILVAKMRAAGYKYDIDGLQEMNLGNGNLTPLELERVTDQTGNVYYRSRDTQGNRIDDPIKENPNAGSVPQLQQLIETYNFHFQCLRDELGEDPNLMQQASAPRVTTQNIRVAQEEANNATGHMEDAAIQCLTETSNKVACLLHDSVEFGAEAYREIMDEKDVKNRVFKIIIEMLPDEQEILDFVTEVNQYVLQHPDFVLYISPFKLKTLAQENLRLASLYFEQAQKRAIKGMQEQSAQQQEQNGQIQQQTAQMSAQAEAERLAMQQNFESSMAKEKQKEIILTGIFDIYSKGLQMPQELKAVESEIITNVALPLFSENKQMVQQVAQQEQAEAEQMEQEQPMQ